MEEIKEFKNLGTMLYKDGEIKGTIREGCERQMCHRIRDLDIEYVSTVKSACCG